MAGQAGHNAARHRSNRIFAVSAPGRIPASRPKARLGLLRAKSGSSGIRRFADPGDVLQIAEGARVWPVFGGCSTASMIRWVVPLDLAKARSQGDALSDDLGQVMPRPPRAQSLRPDRGPHVPRVIQQEASEISGLASAEDDPLERVSQELRSPAEQMECLMDIGPAEAPAGIEAGVDPGRIGAREVAVEQGKGEDLGAEERLLLLAELQRVAVDQGISRRPLEVERGSSLRCRCVDGILRDRSACEARTDESSADPFAILLRHAIRR
jgi:hypothetical protein